MDDLNSTASQVYVLSGMTAKFAGQDLERRLHAAGADATSLQYGVMQRIRYGHATISELSNSMLLAPATLVPVVDALERKGLVCRGRNAQDRRRKELSLTTSGLAMLERLPPATDNDLIAQALNQMGYEKARRLLALLRELVGYVAPEPDLIDRVLAGAPRPEARADALATDA